MDERVLHAAFSDEEPAIGEDAVVDALVAVWLGAIQEGVFFACGPVEPGGRPVVLRHREHLFERDELDAAGEFGEPPFRAYGHSQDHRPDSAKS